MRLAAENIDIQSAIQQSLVDKLDPIHRGRFFSIPIGELLNAQNAKNITGILRALDAKRDSHGITREMVTQSSCLPQLNLLWLITEDLDAITFQPGIDIDSYIESLGDFLLANKDALFVALSDVSDMRSVLQTIDLIFLFIKSKVIVQIQEEDPFHDVFGDSSPEEADELISNSL